MPRRVSGGDANRKRQTGHRPLGTNSMGRWVDPKPRGGDGDGTRHRPRKPTGPRATKGRRR
jgi:hypothetical protein